MVNVFHFMRIKEISLQLPVDALNTLHSASSIYFKDGSVCRVRLKAFGPENIVISGYYVHIANDPIISSVSSAFSASICTSTKVLLLTSFRRNNNRISFFADDLLSKHKEKKRTHSSFASGCLLGCYCRRPHKHIVANWET
uniref:Uncharacterized protein n=1 Tax=Glossina austeni TaxID=7395 RepID=A0A1A9UMW3_GLOAU